MEKNLIQDLSFLSSNEYWGRGILIGNLKGKVYIGYFIMGRSQNSRNRYFYEDGENLAIAPYDVDKLEDSSLIIYYPVKTSGDKLIVTNGDQTDTIEEGFREGKTFQESLRTRCFEPDEPNYTPRISGLVSMKTGDFSMSILKNQDGKGEICARYLYEYGCQEGNGRFIHTYEKNDNPLPTFCGEPWSIDLSGAGDLETFGNTIWNCLDDENKISLCVMSIDKETGDRTTIIKNKRMGD